MSDYIYFFQTFYQLPISKYLLDNKDIIPFIIQAMMKKKPENVVVTDLENSYSVLKIDKKLCSRYEEIFKVMKFWHWDTVYIPKPRHKYKNEDGTLMTAEQIQDMVVEKRLKILRNMQEEERKNAGR